MKLVPVEENRIARKREAIDALWALGQQIRKKYGPTTAAEIREWIEEGRR
jgi:hypothetical protein